MNVFERAMDFLYEKYHMNYSSELKGLPISDEQRAEIAYYDAMGQDAARGAMIDRDGPIGKQVV